MSQGALLSAKIHRDSVSLVVWGASMVERLQLCGL